MNPNFLLSLVLLHFISLTEARAEPAAPLNALARLPVREITVFKDGHAFVLHEGEMPTDDAGNVVMDYLPAPVLGTFWPFVADKRAKLSGVVASQRKVLVPRTALSLPELIEANPNADVHIEELSGTGTSQKVIGYDATLIDVPVRSSEELEETSPPNSGEMLPERSGLIMLKTPSGVSAVPMERIQTLTFKKDYKTKLAHPEFRNLLNLKLKWNGKSDKTANVGMLYLQKGVRWIPNYKVNLHADGTADITLQATLINELTDLKDVTANLVIGVPSFSFADQTDPMALQSTVAQLSPYFSESARTRNAFSNSIMSQAPMFPGATNESIGRTAADLGPEIGESGKNDDLFVFSTQHLTLKKGQRMVVSIAQYALKYKDVYTLEIPSVPPPEVSINYHPPDPALARLLSLPRVTHNIRLTNKSNLPLTTAPALILRDDKLIAQGLMTYTGINGQCDLKLTTAVDVGVKKSDRETKRTPDAIRLQGDSYGRVDLTGTIALTNFGPKPVEV